MSVKKNQTYRAEMLWVTKAFFVKDLLRESKFYLSNFRLSCSIYSTTFFIIKNGAIFEFFKFCELGGTKIWLRGEGAN